MDFCHCVFVVALLALAAEGSILSNFFHNDMVLQYDNPRLFGWAIDASGNPVKGVQVGVTVTNIMSGRVTKATGTSDETGYWVATLPAYAPGDKEALDDPHKIMVDANGFDSQGITGVLFGNVFLCGGQSNMASIGVRHAENNKAELELAGNGALITPCVSHSNQVFTYDQTTGQLIAGGRCLTYSAEEAARDAYRVLNMKDCAPDAASAKDAGQTFTFNGDQILDDTNNCLKAYVEGWSWQRCGYAEPHVEIGVCEDQPYSKWSYDPQSGHLMNQANALCLTALNENNLRKDDPFKNMRIFHIEYDSSNVSLNELRDIACQWTKPTVTTLAKFSAVCWYMGRNLYEHQPKAGMPVGLVESAVSGTAIEYWITDKVFNKCTCHGTVDGPGYLFNAMINPVTYAAFAGMSWYQAESNIDNTECYKCMFPAMIEDWRARFPKLPSNKPVPFTYVEITPRSTDPDFTFAGGDLRLAQQSALALQNVGCAPSQDCGDAESPFNTEHPRVKKPLGHRLALQLRRFVFGESVPDAYPSIANINLVQDKRSAVILFDASTFGGDFSVRTNVHCPVDSRYCAQSSFEVMGNDQKWYPAEFTRLASANGFGVTVTPGSTFPATATIAQIRYLYAAWPLPVIISNSGIPLSPFLYNGTKW